MPPNSSLKLNIIANYLGQGWQALMGFIFIPLYIKYLGVEAYGLIGVFAILQAWLVLLDLGMTPTLSREMARFTGGAHTAQSIRDLIRSIEIVAITIGLIIAFAIWLGSDWLSVNWLKAQKLPTNVIARAFTIMGIVTALRFIENIYRSSIMGLQRQVLLNIVLGFMATARGLGAVGVLALISPTIEAFFIWQGIISIITVGLFALTLYRLLPQAERPPHFSFGALKGIKDFAGGMMAITFLALLLTQVDKILLSRLLTLETFGFYSLAATVANALNVVPGPITAAFYPRFTELVARGDESTLISIYHKGAQLVSVFMGTAAIMLIFFGHMAILLWTRNPELTQRVTSLVAVLSLGMLLNGLMWIPYQMQLAYGWTSLTIKVNVISVAIIVSAILLLVPKYGAIAAAWIWVALNAGYIMIAIHFVHRRLLPMEKWRWYWHDVAMPLMAGALMAALLRWITPDPSSIAAQLFVLMISSFMVLTATTLTAQAVREELIHYLPPSIRSIFFKAHRCVL